MHEPVGAAKQQRLVERKQRRLETEQKWMVEAGRIEAGRTAEVEPAEVEPAPWRGLEVEPAPWRLEGQRRAC